MTDLSPRPLRADAVRNRTNILDAARREITAHGPDVGMDQIASSAGVAVGTLYRHFPTKTDLVAAVVSEFLGQVADRAELAAARVEQGDAAFEQLAELMREIVIATATNQAAKAAAAALNADVEANHDMRRAGVALESIIESARRDGTVRADLSIDDFYVLVSNVPADQPTAVLDRWVDLVLFGLVGASRA